MQDSYEVRRISKQRVAALRKTGGIGEAIVLDGFDGFLIVQPSGSSLGDGETLSHETADYELSPVWCLGSKSRLREARRLLGLDVTVGDRELAMAI